MINVRSARFEEARDLATMGIQFHEESRYAKYEYNVDYMTAFIQHHAANPEYGFVLVAEDEEGPIGGIIGACHNFYFGRDKFVQDHGMFCLKTKRGFLAGLVMLKAFYEEAKKYDAKEAIVGTTFGGNMERMASLYERAGYSRMPGSAVFVREL